MIESSENAMVVFGGQSSQKARFLERYKNSPLFPLLIEIAEAFKLGSKEMEMYGYDNVTQLLTENQNADELSAPGINQFANSARNIMAMYELCELLQKVNVIEGFDPFTHWNLNRINGNAGESLFKAAGGISVGEIVALIVAGMITVYDAFLLIAVRARAMQRATDRNRNDPNVGNGVMWPALGLPVEQVEEIVRKINGDFMQEYMLSHELESEADIPVHIFGVGVSNYNIVDPKDPSNNQLIISGSEVPVDLAMNELRALMPRTNKRGKLSKLLKGGDAYHTLRMSPAQERVLKFLERLRASGRMQQPQFPVYDHEGHYHQIERIAEVLAHQSVSPIRPYLGIRRAVEEMGITTAIAVDGNKRAAPEILKQNGMPNVIPVSEDDDFTNFDPERLRRKVQVHVSIEVKLRSFFEKLERLVHTHADKDYDSDKHENGLEDLMKEHGIHHSISLHELWERIPEHTRKQLENLFRWRKPNPIIEQTPQTGDDV